MLLLFLYFCFSFWFFFLVLLGFAILLLDFARMSRFLGVASCLLFFVWFGLIFLVFAFLA
jgi:hypothetical protein